MPPPELSAIIHNERLIFSKNFNTLEALKPPVHITLFPPFKIISSHAKEFERNILNIQDWAEHEIAFNIHLNNYNYFDNRNKPVLFIEVVRNEQLLKLHKGFRKELKKYLVLKEQKSQFKPHITIGYRDISPEVFPAIKAAYSQRGFNASFNCNAFHLWKHNGQHWTIVVQYLLKGINNQLSLFSS